MLQSATGILGCTSVRTTQASIAVIYGFQGCICVAGHWGSASCSEPSHSFAVLTASCCSAGEATGLELCTSVLELLQWKEDVQDEAELVAPLCKVLQQLLSTAGQSSARSAATPSSGQTAMDISDDEAPSDEEDDHDLIIAQSSRCGSQHDLFLIVHAVLCLTSAAKLSSGQLALLNVIASSCNHGVVIACPVSQTSADFGP